ncbi:hypothetical protein GCM10009608_67660 [Pseudonocardia alaniniphila]
MKGGGRWGRPKQAELVDVPDLDILGRINDPDAEHVYSVSEDGGVPLLLRRCSISTRPNVLNAKIVVSGRGAVLGAVGGASGPAAGSGGGGSGPATRTHDRQFGTHNRPARLPAPERRS